MHVLFGAAGALGAAIVQNLAQQNKAVRAVVRDVGRARKVLPSSAEIVVADASKPDSIKPAFHNVSVIYHCVNVPYDKWTEVMPLVTDNILAKQFTFSFRIIILIALFNIVVAMCMFVIPVIYHHIEFPYRDVTKFIRRSHRFILFGFLPTGMSLYLGMVLAFSQIINDYAS